MDSLSDIAEGLELSAKLQVLADGHWKECDHHGRLPLQGILEDCAHRIAAEARRRRAELEASGCVHFGSVVIEESTDTDGKEPVAASPRGGPPIAVYPAQNAAGRFLSGTLPVVSSRKAEPTPSPAWRRICNVVLTAPLRGGPKWSAARTRQGG
jgi:hypothetical protein